VPTANLADPHPSDDYAGVKSITSNTKAKAHTVAAYAVDTLSLNDQWDITAGLRYDWVRSDYDQTVGAESHFNRIDRMPSYRAGIVYKPAKNGSIYFSHGTSFNPSIEQLALSAATATVDPESEVYELGTKWDLLDKKLGVSAAVFHDVKTNARTPDPIDPLSTVLQGEQVVDGLELSATGNLTDKWQVYSGYALLMSDVSESNTANEEGHQLANVPKHTFNLFTTYDVTNKWQVGAGTNMVSERKARATPDANTGVVAEVPGYTTYDAMTKYNITDSVSIQLNVYNITNKEYFDQLHPGHLIPGAGRTALLSTSFSL